MNTHTYIGPGAPRRFITTKRCLQLRPGLLGAILIVFGLLLLAPPAQAQPASQVVVVPIQGEIDLGLSPFLGRVLAEAAQQGAQAVILDIDTPGGRLDAALEMQAALLNAPVRTIAFINPHAFSAGALIATAAHEIYMVPGAVIGAATPVGADGMPADPKTISAVSATFRAAATLRGRDPAIAAAMVDPAVSIDGLSAPGALLTLTADEARRVGYIDGIVAGREQLLAAAGLPAGSPQEVSPSLAESMVRFLTDPLVAALLVAGGFLLILADLLVGGLGLISLAGIALLALFFWGHMLVGLAGWEGPVLLIVGIALLAVEAFVIPGFGVAGILGLAAILIGLFISLVGYRVVTPQDLVRAGATVTLTFLLLIAGAAFLITILPRMGRLQGLILLAQVGRIERQQHQRPRYWRWLQGANLEAQQPQATLAEPFTAPSLHGALGIALSDLRPSGFAEINGRSVDVVSRGDYIRAGEAIEVIRDDGYRRVVQRYVPAATNAPTAGPAGSL